MWPSLRTHLVTQTKWHPGTSGISIPTKIAVGTQFYVQLEPKNIPIFESPLGHFLQFSFITIRCHSSTWKYLFLCKCLKFASAVGICQGFCRGISMFFGICLGKKNAEAIEWWCWWCFSLKFQTWFLCSLFILLLFSLTSF